MKTKYKTKILNFRIDEKLHAKLKSVAIASRKTFTGLITDIIKDHIDEYSEDALVDQLRQIAPEKRLNLIHKIEAEEKEMGKK